MTFEEWQLKKSAKNQRALERRELEAKFNEEIVKRHQAGSSKEEIVAELGITRELFNRVTRAY